MGDKGAFVILFLGIFSIALTPVIFDDVFAGVIILPPDPPPPPGLHVILFPAPGALPELPGFPGDPQTNPLLGDFKCYLVGNDVPDRQVILIDQFERLGYSVEGITEICNYVLKDQNEDIPFPPSQDLDPDNGRPNQHYKVYHIRCIDDNPPGTICPGPIIDDVLLRDQLGDTRHNVLTPVELWVPQDKFHLLCEEPFLFNPDAFGPGEPGCISPAGDVIPPNEIQTGQIDTDIHWKCYEVDRQLPDQQVFLGLEDLNFGPSENELLDLYKICTPVQKVVCMDGYEFTSDGQCQGVTGEVTDSISFGDSTIDDHLKCYHINPDVAFFFPFGVKYIGQFGEHDFFAPAEWEVCLVASKVHVPESAIGGSFIPINTTSLLLAASYTTASWLIPVVVSGIGIGIIVAKKIYGKKE